MGFKAGRSADPGEEELSMSVTIYHNPKCGKSRETLKIIEAKGIQPTVVEYLKTF